MRVYSYPVIFFDLDDTLTNKDANTLWIKWRAKHERWALVEGLLAILSLYRAYKKGKITHGRLSQYYRTKAYGLTLDEYQERVEQFFAERGRMHIYPQAASLLFAYRQNDCELVLITAADEVMARAYGDALGIDHVLSNRLDVQDDCIVGLQKPLCYGHGKVKLARQFLEERNLSFKDCAFYTDSHADLPLLREVAQPVVLNPNARLKEIAEQLNWPCLDWREETEPKKRRKP